MILNNKNPPFRCQKPDLWRISALAAVVAGSRQQGAAVTAFPAVRFRLRVRTSVSWGQLTYGEDLRYVQFG